eukprot:6255090-Pyramimonas_sp.AAC.2
MSDAFSVVCLSHRDPLTWTAKYLTLLRVSFSTEARVVVSVSFLVSMPCLTKPFAITLTCLPNRPLISPSRTHCSLHGTGLCLCILSVSAHYSAHHPTHPIGSRPPNPVGAVCVMQTILQLINVLFFAFTVSMIVDDLSTYTYGARLSLRAPGHICADPIVRYNSRARPEH